MSSLSFQLKVNLDEQPLFVKHLENLNLGVPFVHLCCSEIRPKLLQVPQLKKRIEAYRGAVILP